MSAAELGVNVERRRAGEVALSVIADDGSGLAWVTAEQARKFAWQIIRAAQDSEDLAVAPTGGTDA